MPYEAYNGVDSKAMHPKLASNNQNGGYCMHSSTLFATWHRPYLALFEQELYQHVQDAALMLGHANDFKDFRLPYWDWTIGASPDDCYPDFFIQKDVTLTIGGQRRTIRNPLASFSADPKRSPDYKGPRIPDVGMSTVRTRHSRYDDILLVNADLGVLFLSIPRLRPPVIPPQTFVGTCGPASRPGGST